MEVAFLVSDAHPVATSFQLTYHYPAGQSSLYDGSYLVEQSVARVSTSSQEP